MNEKHALLSMTPFEEKINRNKLFILLINKQEKLFLYKNLLSNENDLDIEKSTNFINIIIHEIFIKIIFYTSTQSFPIIR